MRTRDRILMLTAGLALGATQVLAFDGTTRPSGDVGTPGQAVSAQGMMPASTNSRAVDVPRPPGLIPRAGAGAAVGLPSATLPRPRAPVPVLSTAPAAPAIDRPLPPPTAFAAPAAPITALEAFRSGARAMRDGQKDKAIKQLEYAAEQGVVAAQWKLARVYAEGDGVEQSDIKAFEYFSRIADGHADDNPTGPQARYVANAFVSLGHYYREGIADSEVKADLGRARHMYAYAASYFADADAQYHLGRLLLDGGGANNDLRQAARWLNAAANKGQYQAQAVLGRMLFKGENNLPRQPARGLMWLAVAQANAGTADAWIGELYESALKQASGDERAIAAEMLARWVSTKRE
jgi:TPR repeat protein